LSPDGEWVVAVTLQGAAQEDLIVVRTDGTDLLPLTGDPHKDRGPRWSPDGKTIAFQSDRSGTFQIWIINADGNGLRQFTYADIVLTTPIWGPKGTRMIVGTPETREGPARALVLDVRKPWSEQTPEVLPLSLPDGGPFSPASWSADERQLALNASGNRKYIYDFETRKVRDAGNAIGARWLGDSRRLLLGGPGRTLRLIDPVTGKSHDLLTILSDAGGGFTGVSLPRDDRLIVYGLRHVTSDIWLASAKDRPTGRQR
jgi:dipeptidyl aminopeptidase/acylaminoacyl peptidase